MYMDFVGSKIQNEKPGSEIWDELQLVCIIKKRNMRFTMKEERKSQQFYTNVHYLVQNSILIQILDFSACA